MRTDLFITTCLFAMLPTVAHAQCETQILGAPAEPAAAYSDPFGLSGDRALVGRLWADLGAQDTGAVHAYRWIAGSWELTQLLLPSDADAGDQFGWTLAVEGDCALIGALDDLEGGADAGRVYEYLWDGAAWVEGAQFAPADVAPEDHFGSVIVLHGERAVISARGDDDAGTDRGAVYVFDRVAGIWTQTAKLLPPPDQTIAFYGWSVALDGDRIAVGAPRTDFQGVDKGVVYIYERIAGQWEGVGRLQGSSLQDTGHFGTFVGLEGERLLASSRKFTVPTWRGRVHTFERDPGGEWSEIHLLHRPDPVERDRFGEVFDLEGDSLLVSAQDMAVPGMWRRGLAFLYEWTPAGWEQVSELASPGYDFAYALARDGERALIARYGSSSGVEVTAWTLSIAGEPGCMCGSGAPCGNEDPSSGCANSIGRGVLLRSCGSASVALDDLRFAMHFVPQSQPVLLFAADEFGAGVPFRDGRLCAMGVLKRLETHHATGFGVASFGPGLGAIGDWEAGEERWFQAWYRDGSGPCDTGSNLSSAVHVAFVP